MSNYYYIGGIIASVLGFGRSIVGSSHGMINLKTITLVFDVSSLSIPHSGLRTTHCWLEIRKSVRVKRHLYMYMGTVVSVILPAC